MSAITDDEGYKSQFRPCNTVAMLSHSLPFNGTIKLDRYTFFRTTFTIGADGTIDDFTSTINEEILLSCNWQLHVTASEPCNEFIGAGTTKYAFCVCIFIYLFFMNLHNSHVNNTIITGRCEGC